MRQPEEAATIERAMQGDAEAFGTLYERFLEDIYTYLCYRVTHTPLAEALTEQVFLKAWEGLPGFRQAEIPFLIWLYQIAYSMVSEADHQRREPPAFTYRNPIEWGHASPEEALSSSEPVERLQWAMALLPALEQDLLILRFVNRLSLEEAASVMERRVDEVRLLQHRALKALDTFLEMGGGKGHPRDHG